MVINCVLNKQAPHGYSLNVREASPEEADLAPLAFVACKGLENDGDREALSRLANLFTS